MQVVYRPEGAQEKVWDYAPERLLSPEAEAIERLTGMPFSRWVAQVQEGSMLALHGLLYVMLKRETPTLKWDQVVFSMAEVEWRMTPEERATVLAALEAAQAQGRVLEEDDLSLLHELQQERAELEAPQDGEGAPEHGEPQDAEGE